MVERLGNSCGAAGTPSCEEQISWRSALMESVTLPSLEMVSMEGDRPGRAGRELRSEKLQRLYAVEKMTRKWGQDLWLPLKRVWRGADLLWQQAAGWPASPRQRAQHQNPTGTALCIFFPAARLLPVGPGSGNPRDPVTLWALSGSAGAECLEWRGEALSSYRFSISALGVTLSTFKITLLTNFFPLALLLHTWHSAVPFIETSNIYFFSPPTMFCLFFHLTDVFSCVTQGLVHNYSVAIACSPVLWWSLPARTHMSLSFVFCVIFFPLVFLFNLV